MRAAATAWRMGHNCEWRSHGPPAFCSSSAPPGRPAVICWKNYLTLLRQVYTTRLAGLRLADADSAAVRIEIMDLEPRQLAVASTGV